MKVAIIHYWLINTRGGEKVLEVLCDIFPDADIYTLVLKSSAVSKNILSHKITTSFIQKLPYGIKKYQNYIPLHPFAIEQFDLSTYDLVVSSESGIAKGVLLKPETCHICYCHSPMRYIWNMYHEYRRSLSFPIKTIWVFLSNYLRQWDYVNSQRVDYFIANSKNVQCRIKKYYNRNSDVVYPPVDFSQFTNKPSDDFYLFVGQLNPYKKAHLAVRAFNYLQENLVVIGEGPQKKELQKISRSNVHILGKQSDKKLADYYSRCKGFIFPGEEDFGITPLEAMASGKPVLAYGKGGALETVINGKTGLFFSEQNEASLVDAVKKTQTINWNPDFIRKHARQFDLPIMKSKLKKHLISKYEEYRKGGLTHSG
ncbi:MAG: glycosyltransferase [Desulfobacterales bacterium]